MSRKVDPTTVPVDHGKYAPDHPDPETMYGLPKNVCFCKRCVISNQRPASAVEFKHLASTKKRTMMIDADGICDACKVAEQKNEETDWSDRKRQLAELCDRYRSSDNAYDCLVPGSGGKDSFYAAWILKYEYGMNPLTVTWAPHIYTEWGWGNFQSWIHAGFDNYLFTPNGRVHRLITRLAMENLFHPFQPFMLGQKNLAPRLAAKFNIPLVFFGENEAEYGNPKGDMDSAKRSYEYFASDNADEIYLGGESLAALRDQFGVSHNDLDCYLPADPSILETSGVEVQYLGYYLKWHPQSCYYFSVEKGGFQASPERTPGTYSKYNSIDDKIDDFHYYTTFIKFGIGRATYDAAQEVRSGDIDREEAVALVRRYDGEFPERFADEIFRYLSLPEDEFSIASQQFEQPIMDRDYFMHLADRFRSPHLWKYDGAEWRLRHTVFDD